MQAPRPRHRFARSAPSGELWLELALAAPGGSVTGRPGLRMKWQRRRVW